MRFFGKRVVKFAMHLLGIALFAVILLKVEINDVFESFKRIDLMYGLSVMVILIAFTFVKGLRWRTIVAQQGINVSVMRSFRIYSASLYLGFITPGKIGDFAKSLYLIGRGMPIGRSIYSSFLDRLLDLVFLVITGYAGILVFPGIFENQVLVGTLLFIVIVTVSCLVFWRRELLKKVARKFASSVIPERYRQGLDSGFTQLLDEFKSLEPAGMVRIVLLTLLAWIMHYSVFIILAQAFVAEVSIRIIIIAISVSIFTSLLPVSISGLGTRELVLILIFGSVGFSKESAVTFSLSFIAIYIIQGAIGLISWFSSPFDAEGEGVKGSTHSEA